MWRALLLLLGLAAATWFEFRVFPGHSYLGGESQLYVPVLERLDTPGYLSRDLVALNPDVSYTVYDEATLLLHEAARSTFEAALEGQQLVFRAAAMLGLFLLARATGLGSLLALLVAALLNVGVWLPGPAVAVTDLEPVPRAFAFGLAILAMGLVAREKPLLAALAGGLAFIYDPVTAAPFWVTMLVAWVLDRKVRILVRPMLPLLLVFILLLANLAQLQPGIIAVPPFSSKVSASLAALQRERIPETWVSLWAGKEIWHYLALFVFALWAAARIWPILNRQMRWLLLGVPAAGLLSVACSYLLLEGLHLGIVARVQPARTLAFTVLLCALLYMLAGMRALFYRRRAEAAAWLVLLAAVALNVRVLDLAKGELPAGNLRAAGFSSEPDKALRAMADWAEKNTWGSSLFLFPDAGRQSYPGAFRAESRRAVWVDWISGEKVSYSEPVAVEWHARWLDTMEPRFLPSRLADTLQLPIDYYVLERAAALTGVVPVFSNSEFAVYDAQDLRNRRTSFTR
jgi:hypothetical protein